MNLIITPNFTGVPNLEKLVLERCKNLQELDPSIGVLKKLILLNLRQCEKLIYLPKKFEMESLVILELSGCLNVKKIPEFVGSMEYLQHLSLKCTAITELPSSVERLVGLTSLTLIACKNLVCLPSTIFSLTLLTELDLSGCSKFDNLPEELGNAKSLKVLNLNGTAIKELSSSIGHLIGLISLRLIDCKNLVCLPNSICSLKLLECLDLFGCSKVENLPKNLGNVEGLEVLNLIGTAIKEVPSSIALLKNLKKLNIHRFNRTSTSYSMPTVHDPVNGGFSSLVRLNLNGNNFDSLPDIISGLSSLRYLGLSGNNFDSLPDSIGGLSSLRYLGLNGNNFDSLPL